MGIVNRFILPFLMMGVLSAATSAHPFEHITDELDLTEAQELDLSSLRAEFVPVKDTANAQREGVMELVNSGDIDAAADMAANQARERVYQRAEIQRRLAEILTPEQFSQMQEIRANQPEGRFNGRPGNRHRGN